MKHAQNIRDLLQKVVALRHAASARPELAHAIASVKEFQSRRFEGTYADLAADDRFSKATRFFLQELYSAKDYSDRDDQFFQIASALQRMLPSQALRTAVALAELHALSEDLDHAMGRSLTTMAGNMAASPLAINDYILAWRLVGRHADRMTQLHMVIGLGEELVRLTRNRGLRLMLKMMRVPAVAAGFGALQHFLEAGFDTFALMSSSSRSAEEFLETVKSRESILIEALANADIKTCQIDLETHLRRRR